MNNNKLSEQLIRKRIRKIILEDDGGAYGGWGDAGGGVYGMHYASKDQLYGIFIKPFVDVVQVGAGKAKELSIKSQTLVKTTFAAIATTFLPGMSQNYSKIYEKEKGALDKIRSQYSSVYGATWDAFKEADVMIAAFMFRPDLILTTQFVRKAPKVAAHLLSVLSGGKLDDILGKLLHSEKSKSTSESVLREKDDKKNEDSDDVEKLIALVKNDKVKKLLANSDEVQKLSRIGKEIVLGTLKDVIKSANLVLSATNVKQLEKPLGKKFPELDNLSKVPENEKQIAEQQLLKTIKLSMKEFYVKQLEAQVKSAVSAGLSQDHPYVKSYLTAISKIKSF
jgi:hypothetical protein